MDRKTILDKVIKLLALSENNSNTSEAKAAKEKAADLMAKYDINIIECEPIPEFTTKEDILKRKKPLNMIPCCLILFLFLMGYLISPFNQIPKEAMFLLEGQ